MYHGSYIKIPRPEIKYSRNNLDFGRGFYLAKDREQAEKWAGRFARRRLPGIVNIYEVDTEKIEREYRVKRFEHYDAEWLQFVVMHRQGRSRGEYDVVSGGIANDRVFNTIELYMEGLIHEKEALGRLRFEEPNWQMCIRDQEILEHCVHYLESRGVGDGGK